MYVSMREVYAGWVPALDSRFRADCAANRGDPKAVLFLASFRLAHWIRSRRGGRDPIGILVTVLHRAFSEVLLGIEIRPRTKIGPGLTIYHGYGIVIHDHATIGANVVLRQGVTIGQAYPGGPSPVIEHNVEFGAGAVVVGGVRIGHHSRIGPNVVVTQDVPPHSSVRVDTPLIRDRTTGIAPLG